MTKGCAALQGLPCFRQQRHADAEDLLGAQVGFQQRVSSSASRMSNHNVSSTSLNNCVHRSKYLHGLCRCAESHVGTQGCHRAVVMHAGRLSTCALAWT